MAPHPPNYAYMAILKAAKKTHWTKDQACEALNFGLDSLEYETFLAHPTHNSAFTEFRTSSLDPCFRTARKNPANPGRYAYRDLGRSLDGDGGSYNRPRVDICVRLAKDAIERHEPMYREPMCSLPGAKDAWMRKHHYVRFVVRVVTEHTEPGGCWEGEDDRHLEELCLCAFQILDARVWEVLYARSGMPKGDGRVVDAEGGNGDAGERQRRRSDGNEHIPNVDPADWHGGQEGGDNGGSSSDSTSSDSDDDDDANNRNDNANGHQPRRSNNASSGSSPTPKKDTPPPYGKRRKVKSEHSRGASVKKEKKSGSGAGAVGGADVKIKKEMMRGSGGGGREVKAGRVEKKSFSGGGVRERLIKIKKEYAG